MPDPPEVSVTWLGHATVLIEMDGRRILTDPFLRTRLGPLRRSGAPPDARGLGAIDAILISHAHPDHFDPASIRLLPERPLLIVPRGLGDAARRIGEPVQEMEPDEVASINGLRVTGVPARHGRWPRHPHAVTMGFLLQGLVSVYFAGDTSRYAGLATRVKDVDVALLPIGSWGPHRAPWHLGPVGAAHLAAEIGARAVIPIHWGTLYPAALERVWRDPLRRPGRDFARAAGLYAPTVDLRLLEPGDRTTFDQAFQEPNLARDDR